MSLDPTEEEHDNPLHTIKVGGTDFTARQQVFCRSAYLKSKLTGQFDKKHKCIVDRSPAQFEKVLNIMRDDNYLKLYNLDELQPEFTFFQLEIKSEEPCPRIEYDRTSAFEPVLGIETHGVQSDAVALVSRTEYRFRYTMRTEVDLFVPQGYICLVDCFRASRPFLQPGQYLNLEIHTGNEKGQSHKGDVAVVFHFLRTNAVRAAKPCELVDLEPHERHTMPKEFGMVHTMYELETERLAAFLDYPQAAADRMQRQSKWGAGEVVVCHVDSVEETLKQYPKLAQYKWIEVRARPPATAAALAKRKR